MKLQRHIFKSRKMKMYLIKAAGFKL